MDDPLTKAIRAECPLTEEVGKYRYTRVLLQGNRLGAVQSLTAKVERDHALTVCRVALCTVRAATTEVVAEENFVSFLGISHG